MIRNGIRTTIPLLARQKAGTKAVVDKYSFTSIKKCTLEGEDATRTVVEMHSFTSSR